MAADVDAECNAVKQAVQIAQPLDCKRSANHCRALSQSSFELDIATAHDV